MFNHNTLIVTLTLLALCVVVFAPTAASHLVIECDWCVCFPEGASLTYQDGCFFVDVCGLAFCCSGTTCHSSATSS